MLITKSQLKNIIKEELTKTMVLREAKRYKRINGRLDEGFISNMSKKFGLSNKAIIAMLAMSTAAGAITPSPALANNDIFGDMLNDHIAQQVEVQKEQVDAAKSLELGKQTGAKVVKLLEDGGVKSAAKLILDLQVGAVHNVAVDGDAYEKGIADTLKASYPNLEIDAEHGEPVLSQKKIPAGTLVVEVEITPREVVFDVIFSVKNAKEVQVLPSSGSDPIYYQQQI